MFVNLSNHPSRDWPPEQLTAALQLASPIFDILFPSVDPQLDGEAFTNLAHSTAGQVFAAGAQAAMVQGEFTMVYALVGLLRQRIPCYAATTERVVLSQTLPGSVIRKTSDYRFVRFREFRTA